MPIRPTRCTLHRHALRAVAIAALVTGALPVPGHATTFELLQSGWKLPAGAPPATGIGAGDLLVSGPLNPGFAIGGLFGNDGTMSLLSHSEGGGLFLVGNGHLTNNGLLESGYTSIGAGTLLENTVNGTFFTNRIDTSRRTAPGTLRTLTQSTASGLASVESMVILGSLANEGSWTDFGSTTVYGSVTNQGQMASTNNAALVLPAPFVLPYAQEIRIAHNFAFDIGPARWTNAANGTMVLGANTTLINSGEFTNHGSLTVLGRMFNQPGSPVAYEVPVAWGQGRFGNSGTGQLIVGPNAQFRTGEFGGEAFTNQGSVVVQGGGYLSGGNHVVNQGANAQITVNAQGGLSLASLENHHVIQVDSGGGIFATGFSQSADGFTSVGGTLELTGADPRISNQGALHILQGGTVSSQWVDQRGGTLVVDGSLYVPGLMTHTGGVISGGGTINGSSFTQGDVGVAAWKPGSSPGTLTIVGDMGFGNNAVVELEAEVDGAGVLAWDHMIASRMTFHTGSTIRIMLGIGTDLHLGDSSEMLTCTVACDFSGAHFEIVGLTGAQIVQGTNGLVVTLAPVPEPQTWALLLAGIGVVGAWSRRMPRPRVA